MTSSKERSEFEPGKKTTRCVRRFAWVDGVRLAVVDTPGWSLFGLADARLVKQEIMRSVMLAPPGYLIFLLVIPVDSFSNQDGRAMEKYLVILGDMVWSHTTRKCGHRYHAVNNKCPEDFNQVTELLNILKQMCARTG